MEHNYCEMCGERRLMENLVWTSTDEHGPVYRCVSCYYEDTNTIPIVEYEYEYEYKKEN